MVVIPVKLPLRTLVLIRDIIPEGNDISSSFITQIGKIVQRQPVNEDGTIATDEARPFIVYVTAEFLMWVYSLLANQSQWLTGELNRETKILLLEQLSDTNVIVPTMMGLNSRLSADQPELQRIVVEQLMALAAQINALEEQYVRWQNEKLASGYEKARKTIVPLEDWPIE